MLTVGSLLPATAMLLVSAIAIGARAEVATRASDQSGHASTEAREITYKEAHDLLAAFLKAPPYAVVKSGDMGYREFYFFMADMGSARGPGGVYVADLQYYAIDRRTGDVWSSIICERIATPALTKLQMALRKRIGLTDAEYKGLRRPGPLCEPGMPRVRSGK